MTRNSTSSNMVNGAETNLSLPTCSKGNADHLQGGAEAGVLTSSQTHPWSHEKQKSRSKIPTLAPAPPAQESHRKISVFAGLWTTVVRGWGESFL